MQFNQREVSDGRVRLRYSVEIGYEACGHSEFLLNVHAARTPRQLVLEEFFKTTPRRSVSLAEDTATGNRIAAFAVDTGPVSIRYDALVEVAPGFAEPESLVAESPGSLPISTLQFLFASRYCQVDLVGQQAWETFGQIARGYAQVRAVSDWVRQTVRFRTGVSGTSTSVIETLRDGSGDCRDFAHVMITFCRALNYPARFVTGVDYGADPSYGLPDFHAYVEVFIGGNWYLFDPTGISRVTGLVRIGTGRDAADVSFATIFGPVKTGIPRIEYGAEVDRMRGICLPAETDMAVSTAA
jgi:transglutaminase-like putative cysteine protease